MKSVRTSQSGAYVTPRNTFLALILSLSCLIASNAFGVGPPTSSRSGYVIASLGKLKDARESDAYAINDRGQVVGDSAGMDPHLTEFHASTRATLWDHGRILDLGSVSSPMENNEAHAYAINNKGQVVGAMGGFFPLSMSGLEEAGAFLWQNGRISLLGNLKDWSSFEAYGINDRGEVVGVDGYRAFLYRNGHFKTLFPLSKRPSGNATKATAINERGEVVGGTTVRQKEVTGGWNESGPLVRVHAFLWRKNRMQDLGALPDRSNSVATALNDRGQVVGHAGPYATWQSCSVYDTRLGSTHAFLWSKGRMTDLGTLPGDRGSRANAINNRTEIVGRSGDHAVLWKNGRIYSLNALIPTDSGWMLTEAHGINSRGQIVGEGDYHGVKRAFLLTPQRLPPRLSPFKRPSSHQQAAWVNGLRLVAVGPDNFLERRGVGRIRLLHAGLWGPSPSPGPGVPLPARFADGMNSNLPAGGSAPLLSLEEIRDAWFNGELPGGRPATNQLRYLNGPGRGLAVGFADARPLGDGIIAVMNFQMLWESASNLAAQALVRIQLMPQPTISFLQWLDVGSSTPMWLPNHLYPSEDHLYLYNGGRFYEIRADGTLSSPIIEWPSKFELMPDRDSGQDWLVWRGILILAGKQEALCYDIKTGKPIARLKWLPGKLNG